MPRPWRPAVTSSCCGCPSTANRCGLPAERRRAFRPPCRDAPLSFVRAQAFECALDYMYEGEGLPLGEVRQSFIALFTSACMRSLKRAPSRASLLSSQVLARGCLPRLSRRAERSHGGMGVL